MKLNDTKYSRWYLKLIEKAKNRKMLSGYVERHHIMPKSLGGSNGNNNIVCLTAREHYVAHLLLMRCFDDAFAKQKMCSAFLYMSTVRNNYTTQRYTSKLYEYHKHIRAKILKEQMTGTNNPMFGRTHSAETRKKISEKRLGVNTNTPESLERKRQRFLTNNPNYDSNIKKKQIEANTKNFEIISPTGQKYAGKNLAKFCREHNIRQSNLITYKKTKGWTLVSN